MEEYTLLKQQRVTNDLSFNHCTGSNWSNTKLHNAQYHLPRRNSAQQMFNMLWNSEILPALFNKTLITLLFLSKVSSSIFTSGDFRMQLVNHLCPVEQLRQLVNILTPAHNVAAFNVFYFLCIQHMCNQCLNVDTISSAHYVSQCAFNFLFFLFYDI